MTDLPRSAIETVARIQQLAPGGDLLGVERSRLLDTLPWQQALPFLRADSPWTETTWEAHRIRTVEQVHYMIREYLPHAWAKANQGRASSALRSIAHLSGLLWLLGPQYDELRERIAPDYEPQTVTIQGEQVTDMRMRIPFFGKAALVAASDLVGFPWRDHDNGEWIEDDGEVLSAGDALASM